MPAGRTARNVKVTMPPGIINGMRITVPKSGAQNNPAMPPGDLHVIARIVPHERFVRDGHHLLTSVKATFFDVMLGKDVDVTSIDGKPLMVTIPPGVNPTNKLRLAGQGMPDPYSGARGDLFIELSITYPDLSDEQRELIKQAAELSKVQE